MFNLSDKELDRLSREAANAYEVEKNTSSWEALEQRLDMELGTAPNPNPYVPPSRGILYPFAYTSLIILIVGAGYFLLKSGKKSNTAITKNFTLKNRKNQESTTTATEKEKTAKAGTKPVNDISLSEKRPGGQNEKMEPVKSFSEKEKHDLNNAVLSSSENTEKKNTTGAAEKRTNTANTGINNNNSTGGKLISDNGRTKTYTGYSAVNRKRRLPGKNASTELAVTGSGENVKQVNANKLPENKTKGNLYTGNPGNNKVNEINSNAVAEEYLSYSLAKLAYPAIKHPIISVNDSLLVAEATKINKHTPQRNKSLNTNRSLEIGFSVAPDYSKVKYAYTDTRLGSSIGLTLDYHLLRRLSVNTAFIYAQKYYEMSGENFHPVRTAALANADIDFVKGSIKMIEIPLNVRYDISTEENTSFFVNAGLSSYLVQNEDYNYFCHYNLGYPRWINQPAVDAHQNFWFATLNLSGGFETMLSENISFQLEPYIKLPLRGIGSGNVSLSSYGISMAIKYSPVLKRSRH